MRASGRAGQVRRPGGRSRPLRRRARHFRQGRLRNRQVMVVVRTAVNRRRNGIGLDRRGIDRSGSPSRQQDEWIDVSVGLIRLAHTEIDVRLGSVAD